MPVLDGSGSEVLVDGLDGVEGDLAALAQGLPAEHGGEHGLGDAPMSVALEEQPLGLQPVVHFGEHVVGGGEHEPLAGAHIDVLEVVVVGDVAAVLARAPGLRLPASDAVHDRVREHVDAPRDAVGLLQHAHVPGEGEEALDIRPRPGVHGLIIVAGEVGVLGPLCESSDKPPLQAGEVLRFVDDEGLEPRQSLWLLEHLLQEVGEVEEPPRFLEVPVRALDVLEVVPHDAHLRGVVVLSQVEVLDPRDVDLGEDRVVHLDVEFFLALRDGDLEPRLLGELGVVFRGHHVLVGDGEAPVREAVQGAEPREVGVPAEVRELADGAVTGLGRGLAGEGEIADARGVHSGVECLLHDVQQIGCFTCAQLRRAEDLCDLRPASSYISHRVYSSVLLNAICSARIASSPAGFWGYCSICFHRCDGLPRPSAKAFPTPAPPPPDGGVYRRILHSWFFFRCSVG